MSKLGAAVVLAVCGAFVVGACSESADVTLHEPGQFKGAKDPLLSAPAASREETLSKRFQLVQGAE